jgi:hypothetical protein
MLHLAPARFNDDVSPTLHGEESAYFGDARQSKESTPAFYSRRQSAFRFCSAQYLPLIPMILPEHAAGFIQGGGQMLVLTWNAPNNLNVRYNKDDHTCANTCECHGSRGDYPPHGSSPLPCETTPATVFATTTRHLAMPVPSADRTRQDLPVPESTEFRALPQDHR